MTVDPPLAGVTPPRSTGLFKALGAKSWIEAVPQAAYRARVWRQAGVVPMLLVNDPDAIRRVLMDNLDNWPKAELQRRFASMVLGEGLLLSEGAVWKSHRRLMAPAFDPRAVAALAPMMGQAAGEAASAWREGPINILAEASRLTLRIISKAMFSNDSETLRALVAEAMPEALALRPSLADLVPGLAAHSVAARERRSTVIFSRLNRAIAELIRSRRAEGEAAPDDLLTRLITAKDPETGAALSDTAIRDQAVIVYVAGHETTSVALTWTFYILSQRPEAEARLHAEVDALPQDRDLGQEDLMRLPYTRAVIEEAMRLYPPAGLFMRQALAADELSGMPVRRGQVAAVSPWIVHRNPEVWPDPERFDPERFLPGAPARPRFAYIPFGAGPHICIGAQLALTEAVIVLATLARRWRLTLQPGQTIALRHRATLRPSQDILMRALPRA